MQSQLLQHRLRKQSTKGETESALQALEKIDERTQFLTSMINALLEFCHTLRQQITLKRTLCDMNVLCQEVVESQLDHIFKPFYRTPDAQSSTAGR
jgi:signal transduction histidine kinase